MRADIWGSSLIQQSRIAYVATPHFQTPYAENFSFNWFPISTFNKNTMVEAVYVGSMSRKAIASTEVNYPSYGGLPNLPCNTYTFITQYPLLTNC